MSLFRFPNGDLTHNFCNQISLRINLSMSVKLALISIPIYLVGLVSVTYFIILPCFLLIQAQFIT